MNHRAVRQAALLTGTGFCAAALSGCGHVAAGDRIDLSVLQGELASVIHLEKLQQGFDFAVHVSCAPSASDGLHFACRIDATTPNRPTQSWTENVSCRAPGEGSGPRCESDYGDALQ